MGTAKRERQRVNRQQRLLELQKAQQRSKTKRRAILIAIPVVLVFAVGALIALLSGGDDNDEATTGDTSTATSVFTPSTVPGQAITGATPCPAADGSSPRTITFEQAPPTCIDPAKTYTAAVTTNKGAFTIAVDPTTSPNAVNTFVALARYHYYDGTLCHRIIADFAVQCGDPAGTGAGTYPGFSIAQEPPADAGAYTEGVVAMANTGQPNSTGGQFFIVVGPDPGLTASYSIVGKVSEGYDTTVAAMEAAADPNAQNGVPTLEPIVLESITITET